MANFACFYLVIWLWVICEYHDYSNVITNKETLVLLGVENRLNPIAARMSLICRDSRPFALVFKWRLPSRSVMGFRQNNFDLKWFENRGALSSKVNPPAQLVGRQDDRIFVFNKLGLNDFYVHHQYWGDTLIGRAMIESEADVVMRYLKKNRDFSFHYAENMVRLHVINHKDVNSNMMCRS